LFVCLFVCLLACLFVCLFVCLPVVALSSFTRNKHFERLSLFIQNCIMLNHNELILKMLDLFIDLVHDQVISFYLFLCSSPIFFRSA
jgi:hypothetical protein